MHSKYNTKIFNLILTFSIVVLIIYSIVATVQWSYYEDEYNRAQDDLVELAIKDQELEQSIESKDSEIVELESEVLKLNCISRVSYEQYSVPVGHNSFRSWMPSTAISSTSKQGKIINTATTDKDGLLQINGCYCVALGTYYGNLGDIFKVTTSTGNTFRVIMSDVKSNKHTDKLHQYTVSNGCMMEFIVNKNKLNSSIKTKGCVSTDIISGNIIKIEKEIKYE